MDNSKGKTRISNISLHKSHDRLKNHISFKKPTLLNSDLQNSNNSTFLRGASKKDNLFNSSFSPKTSFNCTNMGRYKNLKISPNNLKYFNFLRNSNQPNNNFNPGFLTKTNFKANNKINKSGISDNRKNSLFLKDCSFINANANLADQSSINYNFDNHRLSKAGSIASTHNNISYKNSQSNNNNNNVNNLAGEAAILSNYNNNINISTNVNVISPNNGNSKCYNNTNNINNCFNQNYPINSLNDTLSQCNNNYNGYNNNVSKYTSPQKNLTNAVPNAIGISGINNSIQMQISSNINLPSVNKSYDKKATQISLKTNNENLKINNTKDPYAVTKEEKELLNKIGASGNQRDYNSEKNKFLETIYEKLNDKNTVNIKDHTQTYCQKFLNYSNKEVDELFNK